MKRRTLRKQYARRCYEQGRVFRRALGDHRRIMARAFWGAEVTLIDSAGGDWGAFNSAVADSNESIRRMILGPTYTGPAIPVIE